MKETVTETIDNLNSVEFSINAKLQWSGKVKVYADTPTNALNIALSKADDIERIIRDKNKLVKGGD